MAWHQNGAKPLPKTMITSTQKQTAYVKIWKWILNEFVKYWIADLSYCKNKMANSLMCID